MSLNVTAATAKIPTDKIMERANPSDAAPDADQLARFQNSMAEGKQPEAANAQPQPEAKPAIEPEGVGDRIIKGMTSLSDQVRQGREQTMRVIDLPTSSQADLLKAQFAMLQTANTIAAVSKVAEKTTQGIKTLQQGS